MFIEGEKVMRWKTLFILTVLILGANPIMAAPKDEIMVYGFLGESCGKWASYDETQRGWYLLWLKGFFTGHNFGNPGNQIMDLPDDESLGLYFDKYCRDNPLGNITTPTLRLTKELRSKK
jgi:hypothetical protein